MDDLSSAYAAEGATVSFVLANNLTADGAIAVKSGTKAFAKVASAVKAKAAGRSGYLSLRLEPIHMGNQTILLSASAKGNNDAHYERPYHLKFPMGVFRTGDDVEIRSGTTLTVFVAEDSCVGLAFFRHPSADSNQAQIPAGAAVTAFVEGSISLHAAKKIDADR